MPLQQPSLRQVRSADGYELACEVSGDGPVLLGLHGGPGGAGCAYMRPLHRLAGAGRTVVTFDQLGTGRSARPAAGYTWSMAAAAADVDAVRESLGVERVDLLGHSYGGMLALQCALDRPDTVGRLVLSGTSPSSALITTEQVRQVLDVLTPTAAAAALTADALGAHDDPAFAPGVSTWLAAFCPTPDPEAATELEREALDPGPAGVGLWGERLWFATAALRGWDVTDRLAAITAPTLVLHGGAQDMSTARVNAVLAAGIPRCDWVSLPGRGHGMFDEPRVEVYLAVIESFLDEWRPRPTEEP